MVGTWLASDVTSSRLEHAVFISFSPPCRACCGSKSPPSAPISACPFCDTLKLLFILFHFRHFNNLVRSFTLDHRFCSAFLLVSTLLDKLPSPKLSGRAARTFLLLFRPIFFLSLSSLFLTRWVWMCTTHKNNSPWINCGQNPPT